MEINLIVVCATLIIITFFVYMLFKDKAIGGSVVYDTKTGKLKLKKEGTKDNNNNTVGDNNSNNKADCKCKLNTLKEFNIILIKGGIITVENIVLMIHRNNIKELNTTEFTKYVNDKIEVIREYFNREFAKSRNETIRTLTFQRLIEDEYIYVRTIVRTFFQGIYEAHRSGELDEKKQFEQDLVSTLYLINEILEYLNNSFYNLLRERGE